MNHWLIALIRLRCFLKKKKKKTIEKYTLHMTSGILTHDSRILRPCRQKKTFYRILSIRPSARSICEGQKGCRRLSMMR